MDGKIIDKLLKIAKEKIMIMFQMLILLHFQMDLMFL